ncbi:MAG: S1C family serine protease [Oscillospiraceae bacterium]|nr:S1C family serine protease [Oscillospiraceae bacterium]
MENNDFNNGNFGRGAGENSAGDNAESPYFRYSPYRPPEYRPAKKHTAMKAVTITASVLVLIIASALVFMKPGADPIYGGDFRFPSIQRPYNPYSPGEREGNYREFFEEYYGERTSGTTGIPKTEPGGDAVLTLTPAPFGDKLSYSDIYKKCSCVVVAVTAGVSDSRYYWGSGIIMTADGYILTNAHILEGTNSVTITLEDDREFEAKLVGLDTRSDLAVLKIDETGLPCAEFGDSDDLEVGDGVVAIGNPLGQNLRGTMTDGIVSAINRDVTHNGATMTLLQTNAAINEGNSGGPLINMYGQVIGITNMKMISYYSSIEGIGFAIPTATVKLVADELIKNGFIAGRPSIGVTIGTIPASASVYYSLPDGLYVDSVVRVSDAYFKGIRPGDIITAVNGVQVTTTEEVNDIKDELFVGDEMVLTIFRNGETFDVVIRLMDSNELYG